MLIYCIKLDHASYSINYGIYCKKITLHTACAIVLRGLAQNPCGNINVSMMLGGGGGLGPRRFTTALSADFSFSCDYAFL